jgi:hypothetical protein
MRPQHNPITLLFRKERTRDPDIANQECASAQTAVTLQPDGLLVHIAAVGRLGVMPAERKAAGDQRDQASRREAQ